MKTGNKHKVATLDQVMRVCNALGPSYSPSKASLMPTAMAALLELAQERQKAVNDTRIAYALAVNARSEAFRGIPKLAAQIARIANATVLSPEDRREVRLIKRKLYPASSKRSEVTPNPQANGDTVPQRTRSTSSLDKVSMMETFQNLIQVVQSIPEYSPNEMEFKVETLKARLADLQQKCKAVADTFVTYSNAQAARDKVMLGTDGVEATTRDAKDYIRGKFGVRSLDSHKANVQITKF